MGRPKAPNRKSDNEEQDDRLTLVIEEIKAKRQACLEALEQPLPLATLSIVQKLAGLSCPSRPSLPLAQASKLAAYSAITLHLRQKQYTVADAKLREVVLNLINKATHWAWEGLNTHRSGLCIKLWLALAFLVEQADYRHTVDGYVIPLAQKLRDTRDDDIEEAPRKPQNKSQSGGESAVQGNGKGILRALQVAKTRIDQSRPLESGITLDFQYITFLHRLFTYEVIDELYVPISDIDKREQKQSAHLNWQIAVAHHRATQTNPDPEAIMLQAQIQDQPGKFRLLLENLAQEFLIARDEPVDDDVAHNGALPARSMGSPSRFFERHEEEVASHKGRLPAAKEREANDKSKLVLEYWSTLAEAPTSVPRLVELLEVPLPLLRAHLEHLQKEGHDKGREGLAQSAALQCAVLEDCLSSGKAYARLSCDGQASMPSFSAEFADALAQLDSNGSEEDGPCHTDDTAQSLYAQVIEGNDILWEGELPSRLSTMTYRELEQALQSQHSHDPRGAAKKGSPCLMNTLFSRSCLESADPDVHMLWLLARTPGRTGGSLNHKPHEWQDRGSIQECAGRIQGLEPSHETLRHGSLSTDAALPSYDAYNMEVVAQTRIYESFHVGPCKLKAAFRPSLMDLRAVTQNSGSKAQPLRRLQRQANNVKYEPWVDLDEVANVDEGRMVLAQLCRGRLVLAMQFWLWRMQAWLHVPSWASKPEAPVHLPIQEENLRGLCEALRLNDEELLQTSNYLVVGTGPLSRDSQDGSFFGAYIDETQFCRYRFTPAEECPGSASVCHGLAYTCDSLEPDRLAATGSATVNEAHGHEDGGECGAECFLNWKWHGIGPSPVHFPEPDAYYARDPKLKEEVIDEILDILEILRLSKLLSMDIVRGVAMLITAFLRMEDANVPGANLLQVTWEHMAVLPAQALRLLRDSLLRCLGQHWRWAHPVREAEDQFLLPLGCFQLKADKSAFLLAQVPARQEVIDEATARAQPCSCCLPGAEQAPEELPGPPANPPKQPRSRGRPEAQPHDSGLQCSVKAGAGPSTTAASSALDLAQELHDAYNNPQKLSKFIVEVLYGAGNKAAAMLPYITHMPRTEGCAQYRKQMLAAAACAKLVKTELEHKHRLSRSLQRAVGDLIQLRQVQYTFLELARKLQAEPEDLTTEAVRPLVEIFQDVQSHAAGVWAGFTEEVHRQAETVKAQSSAVEAMTGCDKAPLPSPHTLARDSHDDILKVRANIMLWQSHTKDVEHRLGAVERHAAKTGRIPSPELLLCILRQMDGHSMQEMSRLVAANSTDLREATAAGVLALTSAEHRLGALRTAMMSIERRLEQELKLYCGDVLQTSLAATLSEKLHREAKSEMEEMRRKAEELLLFGEAESENQRLEAAAKRAAKKERQLRQKAEAQRAAEEKAAAEAAAAGRGGAEAQASQPEVAEAEAPAGEIRSGVLEVPIMDGTNGECPASSLHSHSLGGDAYSEDEFEEACDDGEQECSSGVGSALNHPGEGKATNEASPDRGAESSEQCEVSAAAAQRKKRNKGGRKRAAAVRAGSEETQQQQQHNSSGASPTDWPSETQDDGSEWQEAKPRRSHQRKEQQQQQQQQQEEPKEGPSTPQRPQQGLNGHSERSSRHDRPPAAASASQRRDPVEASVSRPKPAPSSRECAQCGNTAHRAMECPQLRSLKMLDRADCCIALMDGDRVRVDRIRAEPRRSCHVCDATHDLRSCPWLQGMPEAMKEDLRSAYKTLRIREKDRILLHWIEIRRDVQRRLPAASPLKDKSGAPCYPSPGRPLQPQGPQQGAPGTGKPQGAAQQQVAPQAHKSAPMHAEHARHDSATSAVHRPDMQRTHPVGGGLPAGHTQAAQQQEGMGPAHSTASSQVVPHPAPQTPRMRQQAQVQWNALHATQGAEHSVSAYDLADDEAASEQNLLPSPARPQPRNKSHPATEGAPADEAHSDPYAGFEDEWEGESSEAEETTCHQVNFVGGMEPAVGVPVEPGVTRTDVDFDSLMTMLRPQPTGPKGWSKVVVGEPADPAVGPTPGEAQRSAAAAAQAKQEEDDMQAAIQASLTQTRPAPAQLTRLAQQTGQPQQALTGPGAGMPGLQNQIGEYNCFLNVVVQCLWHCRDFKRQFSSLAQENPAIVQSNDVVAGLADLFRTFDAQERQSGEQQESTARQIVAPTKLRDALHALDPHRFSTGEMSDAAEVLGAIYGQLAELPKIGALATQAFELPVREAVHCLHCGKDTHQSSFVQSFYCVSATALRMQAMLALADNEGVMPPLGELLLEIDAQDQKTCDTDERGCGRLNPIQRFLEGVPPPVFTLQLAWESHAESAEAITEVLDAVQEEVDIGEIYKALGSKEYRLHSMVCYYGEHYHAFVHTEGKWVAFDDATLNHVGGWEEVVKKCILGRIQPSLLFYEEALGG